MSDLLLKKELRKCLFKDIAALPDKYISESNAHISYNVFSLKEYTAARSIMIYYSVEREIDTLMIADAALAAGKTVAFPYCYRGGIMDAKIVDSLGELEVSMLGIPAPLESARVIAPAELDLIIVPALAYDLEGYRIGYGGGYYDRYLVNLDAFTVGLARERLVKDRFPREAHDIAVKCVITESSAIRIGF